MIAVLFFFGWKVLLKFIPMFYPEFILPVLLSIVLRPLVAFGGQIQGSDNQFRTVFAMRVCPD
jgi:hypothetical protein